MRNLKRALSVKIARKFNKTAGNTVDVPSIISEGTQIKGNISSKGSIHIDGKVEGDVICNDLVIGVKGAVKGSVKVAELQLFGTLQGKAIVDKLFIAKSAKLIGDTTHSSIAIEPGAYIDGHCIHAGSLKEEQPKDVNVELISAKKNK